MFCWPTFRLLRLLLLNCFSSSQHLRIQRLCLHRIISPFALKHEGTFSLGLTLHVPQLAARGIFNEEYWSNVFLAPQLLREDDSIGLVRPIDTMMSVKHHDDWWFEVKPVNHSWYILSSSISLISCPELWVNKPIEELPTSSCSDQEKLFYRLFGFSFFVSWHSKWKHGSQGP